jgi:hypothetical protein
MITAGPVHFIHLGGPFEWQHARAIVTAAVHDAPIVVHHADDPSRWAWEQIADREVQVEMRPLELPAWLRDHPIQLANVKDLFVWRILGAEGGLYLDLDTISLASVWDLLTRDVLVSQEWPDLTDPVAQHPYNSAVVAARAQAPVLAELALRAFAILGSGESRWGKTGPHLLTRVVAENPDAFDVAPFGVLSGWRDDTIDAYYDGARPGPDVRVIHCYSSSRPERFLADRWIP